MLQIQWNLDLRKILGVTKSFLNRDSFLHISNTRKPMKKHNFAKRTSETVQILIALALSNTSDYIYRYFYIDAVLGVCTVVIR